jgi:hypothetical protein
MVKTKVADTNRADYRCKAHFSMAADLELVRDCERGTPAIKARTTSYLPKWPGETTKTYNLRLKIAVFFNTYRKIKNGLVGMICKTNPELGSDIPAEVLPLLENIDNAGRHIDVFVKDVLQRALEGHCYIFVDYPKPLPPGSTAYQAQAAKRRPFWSIYAKDQGINGLQDTINGEEVLTQITFEEFTTVKDGRYGEKEIQQYRTMWLPVTAVDADSGEPAAYGPMEWEVKRLNPKNNKLDIVDQGTTKLARIPVVPIYTNKRGFMLSDPYLLDLAHLCIAHYQEYSDLKTQQKALVPILVYKHVDEVAHGAVPKDKDAAAEETKQIGPNVTFDLTGKDDDLNWISHDSKGVEVARQNLQDLEQRMSALGLSIIAPKDKVAVTATDKLLDQGERTSELGTIARNLQDGIERCLGITAQYLGKADANGDGGSIRIIVDTSDASTLAPIEAPKDPATPVAVPPQRVPQAA